MKRISRLLAVSLFTVVSLQTASGAPLKGVTKSDMNAAVASCIKDFASFNISVKEELRTFMGVSKERTAAVFCQRLIKGVVDGRINYSDINKIQGERSTQLYLVLKGK